MSLLKLRKPTLNHQPQMTPLMRQSLKRHTNRSTKRLMQAEKACEKRMKAKVAEIKKEAQAEIRKAERKQAKKSALQRKKSSQLRMSAICSFVTSDSAVLLLFLNMPKSLQNFGQAFNCRIELMDAQKSVRSLCICRSKKGVMLAGYSRNGADVYKIYKKQADLDCCIFRICVQC